jgi:hypothetical protein
MKYIAIGFVIIILATAFYIHDRSVSQIKTLNLADSLDNINLHINGHRMDSLINVRSNMMTNRLIQFKRHIDFQDRIILRLSKRLDSLIQHGKSN